MNTILWLFAMQKRQGRVGEFVLYIEKEAIFYTNKCSLNIVD